MAKVKTIRAVMVDVNEDDEWEVEMHDSDIIVGVQWLIAERLRVFITSEDR